MNEGTNECVCWRHTPECHLVISTKGLVLFRDADVCILQLGPSRSRYYGITSSKSLIRKRIGDRRVETGFEGRSLQTMVKNDNSIEFMYSAYCVPDAVLEPFKYD